MRGLKSNIAAAGQYMHRDVYYCKSMMGRGYFVRASGYKNFPKGVKARTIREMIIKINSILNGELS